MIYLSVNLQNGCDVLFGSLKKVNRVPSIYKGILNSRRQFVLHASAKLSMEIILTWRSEEGQETRLIIIAPRRKPGFQVHIHMDPGTFAKVGERILKLQQRQSLNRMPMMTNYYITILGLWLNILSSSNS
uniref:RNA-binding protein n=1 Tax=Temperate fruit decay-associated virus TaxID=1628899 RepID=A0A0H3VFP5_9VIRU|nr:viral RNA-binding protein [Temperate fruit decay-associated virus]AKR53219.1 RNA-binding protein [Temperate fruit decay-associated virus]AKR53223.1 RNA-binding protein [Temperate fruit decay-associated virus]AKR53227.1 RNA-binding protein [Temperate fruit decay-associated virus]AKR53231.1 RNA-binding protein [Temperate fruit decay-associated virus]